MAKFADLDRDRQEQILVNQAALFFAVTALSQHTGQPLEAWMVKLAQSANAVVSALDDSQLKDVIAQLDANHD